MSVSMRLVPVTPALLCQDKTGNCEQVVVKLTESPLTHSTDPVSLKRMLKPMTSTDSPVTSPEMGRKRYNYYNNATTMPHSHQHAMHAAHLMNNPNLMAAAAAAQMRAMPPPHGGPSRFSNSRSSHEIGRSAYMAHQQQMHNQQQQQQQRGLYLELDQRDRGCMEGSPPSDNVIFDNQCYATTPSSSNGNSDQDQPYGQRGPGRHTHHHQVDTGVHFNSFQLAHICSSSIPESAECYAGPRFAHITTAARV